MYEYGVLSNLEQVETLTGDSSEVASVRVVGWKGRRAGGGSRKKKKNDKIRKNISAPQLT